MSEVVLTKSSHGKEAFPEGHIGICTKVLFKNAGADTKGGGDYAVLQSSDVAAMRECCLSFSRQRMCESTFLGLKSNCEFNNFWSNFSRGKLAK
jgi:hypothetical protein